MPQTRVVIFRDADGSVPLLDWLDQLSPKVVAKARVRIERLAELGHELRRPEADLLRDGIYELRFAHQHVNYRILYFFDGNVTVVLSHGLTKEKAVPPVEIDRAIRRRAAYLRDRKAHTAESHDA